MSLLVWGPKGRETPVLSGVSPVGDSGVTASPWLFDGGSVSPGATEAGSHSGEASA